MRHLARFLALSLCLSCAYAQSKKTDTPAAKKDAPAAKAAAKADTSTAAKKETTPAAKKETTTAAKKDTAGALVDINAATKDQLMTLPGIGEALAQKIIDGRPYANKTQLRSRKIIPGPAYDGIAGKIIAKQKK